MTSKRSNIGRPPQMTVPAAASEGQPISAQVDAAPQGSAAAKLILSNTGYIEFEIVDVEVTVNDPVAWVTCVERITSSAGEGGGSAAAEVAATNLFVLDATGWRIALHHASPIIRPGLGGDES